MLQDTFGRTINYLRLSVTDRCDFRCVYCMAEDMLFVPRSELLTIEEMSHICAVFAELGVKKVRVTGGEPLVRRGIDKLFAQLGQIQSLDEITLTTNGSQLPKYSEVLVKAGVRRINISLDSLKPDLFKELTRTGELSAVIAGIESALTAGLKVKLNAVILKNRNSDEMLDLVNFALGKHCDISFIEEMPLGAIEEHGRKEEFVSSADLRAQIERSLPLQAIIGQEATAGPSRYWQVTNSNTRIGFISPHSNNFCGDCNRVRLTATGRLLLCLGNEDSVDLRAVVRAYPDDKNVLKQTIIDAMQIKPERHFFDQDDAPQIVRFMNMTGG